VDIRVFNAVGELTLRSSNRCGSGVQTTDLDLTSFAPGVYFYMAEIHYDSGGDESLGPERFAVVR